MRYWKIIKDMVLQMGFERWEENARGFSTDCVYSNLIEGAD